MMPKKPLYFLTHEGRAELFSGYGIPIIDEIYPLMGMLMETGLRTISKKSIGSLESLWSGLREPMGEWGSFPRCG